MILVHVALMLTIFFGLVGAGVDYGVLVIENTRIQNAIDAAALAAARSLVSGTNPGTSSATTTATTYLSQHGYTNGVNNVTVAVSFASSLGNGVNDTATVHVTRQQGMFFWRAIGINQVTVTRQATAVANGAYVDVMLSLDLTGSMELYSLLTDGTYDDIIDLRSAVVSFVNQMNPSSSDTLGPKVGMARFAGVGCSWTRGNGNRTDNGAAWAPTPQTTPNTRGDGDRYIDFSGDGSNGLSTWTEYVTPCYDDRAVLSKLTYTKADLIKLADNSGAGSCPSMPTPIATVMPSTTSSYACPLTTYDFVPAQVYGTPVPVATRQGYQVANSTQSSYLNGVTGTRLPNAITAVSNLRPDTCVATSGCYYAWHQSQGARNDVSGEGYARKVLVLMTDGVNEIYPTANHPLGAAATVASSWDTEVLTKANELKLGIDQVAGTQDDVEIYVVGFFCTPYNASSNWCQSNLAATTPHPCPSNSAWPVGSPSAIDTLLRNISSSSPNTCDHYFPISKDESLPQLFRTVAGSVARGKLSN